VIKFSISFIRPPKKKIEIKWSIHIFHVCYMELSATDPEVEVEVEVNLQQTARWPVCPGVRRPSGTRDQFFSLLEISFRQLRLFIS
jgi:hypothetical protein